MTLYYEKGCANWKGKAIGRGKEGKLLRQLLGETKAGRDAWRSKYEASQLELAKSHDRIRELELELKKKLKSSRPAPSPPCTVTSWT